MTNSTVDEREPQVNQEAAHIPVMPGEVVEYLNIKPSSCIVDATIGLGGHTALIAKVLGPEGQIIGIDRDGDSLELAKTKLSNVSPPINFVKDDYRNIDQVLNSLSVEKVDGILLDLGISSYQLNSPERGFSFNSEGPLDMRMDQESYISAYDLVNSLSEKEISSILKNFGQERWHHRIARSLVYHRSQKAIASTKDLTEIILKAMPARHRRQKIHPATRTFQAIRIAVNRELEALEVALDKCVSYLRSGGRICVISFHSLEDRIVKNRFRHYAKTGDLKLIVKKPLRPTESEVINNPRARSARLRVAEKIA